MLAVVLSLVFNLNSAHAQDKNLEKEIITSLRLIGHEVLLMVNDSTSRVLPISREEDRYKISFASEIEFIPEDLVKTIDNVMVKTKLAESYIVEVKECTSGEVVYSFKMDYEQLSDIVPCGGRVQPEGCYDLVFTLLEISDEFFTGGHPSKRNTWIYVLLAGIAIVGSTIFMVRKRAPNNGIDPNWIRMGSYYFDSRNMELIIQQKRIELTSKEADLLMLLYNSANTTVEREVILNMVWGDEGDYVGRTLDVFISKLRKKLEFDSEVKIVNIRGVGYKLVVNDPLN